MASSEPKTLPNGLPDVKRFITTHDSNGQAILSDALPDSSVWEPVGDIANFFLAYTTRTFPTSLSPSDPSNPSSIPMDIQSYEKDLSSPPGLTVSGGTVLRFVEMAPNVISPMHRTVSIDYGVVLEGTVELVLDSGETRVMRRGDVCVQRGTNHAWRNITPNDGWSRMLYVLTPAEKLKAGGKELGEDLGGMVNVKPSD